MAKHGIGRSEVSLDGYRPEVYIHGNTSYRKWHPDSSRLAGEVGRNVDELDDELEDVMGATRSRAGVSRFGQTRSVKKGNPHRG